MNKLYLHYTLFFVSFYFVSFSNAQFVKNNGQLVDLNQNLVSQVDYFYGCQNTSIYFERDRVVYSFITPDKIDESLYDGKTELLDSLKENRMATYSRMDMLFLGSNSDLEIQSGKRIQGDIHYYLNKRNGIRNVSSYENVVYKNIYSGIDVKFYQHESGLKYDFILHKGAKIEDIKVKFLGAERVRLEDGKLIIETKYRKLKESIPLSFIDGDKNKEVEVNYLLDDDGVLHFTTNTVDFASLTIDPVMEWATYFNNTSATTAALDYYSSHLDASGNFYLYGQTYSAANNYPVVNPGGAYTAAYNASSDVYLAKFSPSRELIWSTYLGGSGSDNSYGSNTIESYGNVLHVVGERISAGAPFTNGGGYYNATADKVFWARFNLSTGALEHLTSLGGGYDPSVAVGSSGQVAIIMDAYDFSTPPIMSRVGAYNQATNGGFKDMYLFLTNTSYSQVWGTYLGGPATQENFMCRFDNADNIVFVGETSWGGSSTTVSEHLVNLTGAYNNTTHGGGIDVLIGKFSSAGALVWNTLYGGNNSDARQGQQGGYAKIDFHPTTQELVLVFNTTSSNLTTVDQVGAYYKTVPVHANFGIGGSFDNYAAYMVKFSTSLARNYATYWYNGTGGDLIMDASFGGCGKYYIGGKAFSPATTIPLSGGFNLSTGQQSLLMQFDASDFSADWSSYLANNISYNPQVAGRSDNPRIYVAARGYYNNGPTTNPGGGAYYESNNINGTSENFMIWQLHPTLSPNISGTATICSGQTTTLTASGGSGTYEWYSLSSGGSVIFTGAVFTTGALNADTTFYVRSSDALCSSARVPYAITVNTSEDPSFSFAQASYCVSGTDPTPTITGVTSGTFSSTPAGLSMNSGTGTIDVSASTINSYTITYTTGGTCPGSTTFDLSIQSSPVGTFNYAGSPYCATGTANVTFTGGGAAGTFTSTAGLSINGTTGAVNLATSTPNTYTVTNTIAPNGGCPQVIETADITIQAIEDATFGYSAASYCGNNANITPTITGVIGGTFSALPAGLDIDPATGEIDFSASTIDDYVITYTTGGTCPGTATFDLNIKPPPVGTFNYSGSPYCATGTANVTFTGGGIAGTFTSTAGLSINSSTGQIDLAASTPNTYIVTNTIAASTCPQVVETASITIQTAEDASFNYSSANYCISNINETPTITGVSGGAFSALPAGLDIDPSTGEIDFSASSVNSYTITYTTAGACPGSATFDVDVLAVPSNPNLMASTATVCINESVTITISSPQAGVTYNIYDAASGGNLVGTAPLTFTPTVDGSYFIEAENAGGCVNASGPVEFQFTVNPLPTISSNGDRTICPGEDATLSVIAPAGTISWSNGGSENFIIVSPSSNTTYTATVTDGNSCQSSVDLDVIVVNVGSITAIDDNATVASGGSIDISVLQNDGGGMLPYINVTPTSGSAVVNTNGTITYNSYVGSSGTDQFTYIICSDVCVSICDTADVFITITKDEIDFVIPEGFSPNADGTNDVFEIPNLNLYPNTQVVIFNRWGAKVFESDNYQNNWDGRSQSGLNVGGDELPEGTFYYLITMGGDLDDGISGEVFKGYLYLKR